MKSSVRFNSRLLTTSTFDSAALGLLVHLVHRFPQAGTAILVVIAATIVVDAISGTVRRRIIEGSGGTADETELAVARLASGAADG